MQKHSASTVSSSQLGLTSKRLCVVVPSFKATQSILDVLERLPPEVEKVYVVDDACPDGTGKLVEAECQDQRVSIIYHEVNKGVGGAVKTGYLAAVADGFDVIVKLDSDGQMAPEIIAAIAGPVIAGGADYSKGNRFWNLSDVSGMPTIRIIGNAGVSFLSKLSTGYWHVFDPANGYTAISADAVKTLPLDKIADRYFFESDMLFRLALDHRIVADVPMKAIYAEEVSHLNEFKSLFTFLKSYGRNFLKRIFYEYILRDFNFASISIIVAIVTLPIGFVNGIWNFGTGLFSGVPSTTSSLGLTSLLLLVGYMSLLNFLAFDYSKIKRSHLSNR